MKERSLADSSVAATLERRRAARPRGAGSGLSVLALLISTTVSACSQAIEPPHAKPPPPVPSTAPLALAASNCETGRSLVDGALAAEREGRLGRAFRKLEWARATGCPELAASSTEAASRLAATLVPPWGDDTSGIERAKDNSEAYGAAARAFQAGKTVEAARGALASALAGENLRTEGLLIAARAAEAAGEDPRAKRMFARAYHAACSSGIHADAASQCGLRPRMPRSDLFAYAAAIPGFRPWKPSCVLVTNVAGGEALSPDGGVAVFATHPHPGVEFRLIPSRVLLGARGLNTSDFVCVGDAARTVMWFGTNGRLEVGAPGARPRTIDVPKDLRSDATGLVAADGTIFIPHFPDVSWGGDWYRAAPGDTRLRRIPLPTQEVPPVLLSDGSLLGYEGKANDPMPLARFDGATGKRLGPIALASRGIGYASMPDGKRVAYLRGDDEVAIVDPFAKTVVTSKRVPFTGPIGFSGPSLAIFPTTNRAQSFQQDLVIGARIPRDVIERFGPLSSEAARLAVKRWAAPEGPATPPSTTSDGQAARDLGRDEAVQSLLLRELGVGGDVASYDGRADLFVIGSRDEVGLARMVGGKIARLRITFAFGMPGGMAIDEEGYYEFFGDISAGFRAAAACGDEWPIEMCSDRFEAPGLLQKFLRGDLSYRAP